MDKKTIRSSNISLDSLEIECKRKTPVKEKAFEENADTILVPFYEKDVLIKVPKRKKRQLCTWKNVQRDEVNKKEQNRSYLINRDSKKGKKTSYLEMFRQQFTSNCREKPKKDPNDIGSLSPEVGNSERESIEGNYGNDGWKECNASEFYNTEPYNEIYYEKLMKNEFDQYLDQSFEEALRFNEEIGNKYFDIDENNLRSISEVSRPRRNVRRASVPPLQNVRLGGLGPDVENIKPRLERAKSLQRYSEKVRMENRLRIYKKAVKAENDKKAERELSAKQRDQAKVTEQRGVKNTTYLVNKAANDNKSITKKIYNPKSKSADVQRHRERDRQLNDTNDIMTVDEENIKQKNVKPNSGIERKLLSAKENLQKYVKSNYETIKLKSSARSQHINDEEKRKNEIAPVQISFLVNVGGLRPSSALKSLEEKHKMYQEKVKDYTTNM